MMYWGLVFGVVVALFAGLLTSVYSKYSSKRGSGHRSIFAWMFHLLQRKPLDVGTRWIWADLKGGPKMVHSLQSGRWGVVVASQSAAFQILGNNKKFPKKVDQDSLIGALFGSNLLLSNGDAWRRYRQVLAPPFRKPPNLRHVYNAMKDVFSVIEAKPKGTLVDVFRVLQHMSLNLFAKTLLDMDSVKDTCFLDEFNSLVYEALDPLQLALPWTGKFRSSRAKQLVSLDEIVEKIIETKALKEDFGMRNDEDCDVLSLMLKAKQDPEVRFTRAEIKHHLTLMFLPTITTASTMAHVLHHLARDQSIQKKLRTEVRIFSLGSQIPTADQISQMPLLSAIIKETMRLSPAFAQLPTRVATKLCQIDGVEIPPGTDIVIDLFTMQRNPEYYEEPLKFDPERFMLGNERLPWFSFGGGMRICIGMRIALLELKAVIAMLVSRYTIAYPPGSAPNLDPALASCQLLIPLDVNLIMAPITDNHS